MNKLKTHTVIIVIWYNPLDEHVFHTYNICKTFPSVLVIDNSHKIWQKPNPIEPSFQYLWMKKNQGISGALNYGCNVAMAMGAQYVLTLDQDSKLEASTLEKHLQDADKILTENTIAVVATAAELKPRKTLDHFINVKSAITSGSLIRLEAWQKAGGFDERLFIDQVDHDFCARVRRCGYQVLVNMTVMMSHQVGDPVTKQILGLKISTTNHHWQRRYYQVRNSLYLRKWHPSESKPFLIYLRELLEMCVGIVVLEKDRHLKLKAILIGVIDFYHNRTGSWQDIRPNAKW